MTEKEMILKMAEKGYRKEHQLFWDAVPHHFCVCMSCLKWVELSVQKSNICYDCQLDKGITFAFIPSFSETRIDISLFPETGIVTASEEMSSFMKSLSIQELHLFTDELGREVTRFLNEPLQSTEQCSYCDEEREFQQMKLIQTLNGPTTFCSDGCLHAWEAVK